MAAHLADGTYREDRHGNLSPPVEVPAPGGCMSDRAREIYDDLAEKLVELGVVSTLDSLALTETASCAAMLEACREHLAAGEYVVDGRENPLCGLTNRLQGTLYRYLCQLGLTPKSRTGLTVTTDTGPDPLDIV